MKTLILALTLLVSGCCSAEIHESSLVLLKDHKLYSQAVVPHPSLSEEDKDKVTDLGKLISVHLEKLEELSR